MGRFDRGVTSYTFATAEIQVAFPEDDVKCRWCPFMKHYDGLDRDKCELTNKILFSKELIGADCPLTIVNKVDVEELK